MSETDEDAEYKKALKERNTQLTSQLMVQNDKYTNPREDSQDRLMSKLLDPSFPPEIKKRIEDLDLWVGTLSHEAAITYLTPVQVSDALYRVQDLFINIRCDMRRSDYIRFKDDLRNIRLLFMFKIYRSQGGFERKMGATQIRIVDDNQGFSMTPPAATKKKGFWNTFSGGLLG